MGGFYYLAFSRCDSGIAFIKQLCEYTVKLKTTLRILEPILLVCTAVWALVVIFVGSAGQEGLLMHLLASSILIVLGFVPYAIVAGILRHLRKRTVPDLVENPSALKFSKVLIWVAGITTLLAIAGVFASAYYFPKYQKVGAESTAPEQTFWTYEYQPLHMRVTIGEEWEQISNESVEFPQGITGARFAFRKEGTSCVLAYATAPEDALRNYADITDEMETAGNITDRRILDHIYNRKLSTAHSITAHAPTDRLAMLNAQYGSGDSKPALTFHDGGIIFASSHFTAFMESSRQAPIFVLFDDGTGAPWDGHCLSDTVKVIEHVDWLYDPITLTPQSEGALYITSEVIDGEEVDQVRFVPSGTDTPYAVMGMTATSHPMPQIVDGTLYVVVGGDLHVIDPFTKTTSNALDIDFPEHERVHAFLIISNKILYLAGENCLNYLAKCNLILREYDRTTKRSTQLTEKLPYRELIGYDSVAEEILLTWRDRDGSERWENSGIYKYADGSLREIKSLEKEQARFTKVTPTYDHAQVSNGALLIPTQSMFEREDRWTISYP